MQFGTVEYDVKGRYVTRGDHGPVQPISIYAIDLTCPDAAAYLPILERTVTSHHHSNTRSGIIRRGLYLAISSRNVLTPKIASSEAERNLDAIGC